MADETFDRREAEVWCTYQRLHRALGGALDRQLERDAGISGADYALLVPLARTPGGVLRMRELGLLVEWDRSRLSHHVSRMVKRGLVVRENCSEDARGANVRLTDAGREAVEAAQGQHRETVRRYFFDQVSPAELDVLGRVFTRMLTQLTEDDHEGPCNR
ncbi:MarR family winged helix-turn-helix transcriptional regulator [Amycolatopsis jejuensis]|uniref:MarR family winged helix-turn-helix transcriptional regulator n=1 Tax=Amycolatopsis jejuensis TaxID=330084 RepID=UPI000525C403|nr:MarR family winged helix-turn-helix transcriptional regulator [Amycolatopsis jejuensis]